MVDVLTEVRGVFMKFVTVTVTDELNLVWIRMLIAFQLCQIYIYPHFQSLLDSISTLDDLVFLLDDG